MDVAHAVPMAAARSVDHTTRGWIHSRPVDLALFILSPLSGVAVVLAALYLPWGAYVAMASVYFVAIPHYLSTFTFYFGDENFAYYRTRWVAFFLGPLVCIAIVFAAIWSRHAHLYQAGQFTWNIYHVALQGAGILGLYRLLNGGPASERPAATLALLSTAAAMAFFQLDRYPPLWNTLSAITPSLPPLVFPVTLVVAIASVLNLFYKISRRQRRIAVPEAAFLGTSLLLFHPYLWVADSELATLGMLMGHFVQYLGIVWLLHHRKYGHPSGSPSQRMLGYVSGRMPVLIGTLAATGVIFLIFDQGSRALGIPWLYQMAWNVLVIMHFYLDGLIWAFRRPFIRESVGSYLILPDHRAA